MGQHKLTGTTVRSAIAALVEAMQRPIRSAAGFRPIPSKPRLSTRGLPRDTWRTKTWTECRRDERKFAIEKARKAADKADHTERTETRRRRYPRYTNGGRQRPYCNV